MYFHRLLLILDCLKLRQVINWCFPICQGVLTADHCPGVSGCRSVIRFKGVEDTQDHIVDLSGLDVTIRFNNTSGKPVWLVSVHRIPVGVSVCKLSHRLYLVNLWIDRCLYSARYSHHDSIIRNSTTVIVLKPAHALETAHNAFWNRIPANPMTPDIKTNASQSHTFDSLLTSTTFFQENR